MTSIFRMSSTIFQGKTLVISNQTRIITRLLSSSNHWSFSPSFPSKTVPFNPTLKMNDDTFQNVMASKLDCDKEKLSICGKSHQLTDLFNNVSIDKLDNVLKKNIMKQADIFEQKRLGVDEWMLFNYEKHQNPKSWMLNNANG
eukprot:773032_1